MLAKVIIIRKSHKTQPLSISGQKQIDERRNIRDCDKCIIPVYIIGKIAVQIIMLINIHIDYQSETGWDTNLCPNLESLTLFWLIWNYINICLTFIFIPVK